MSNRRRLPKPPKPLTPPKPRCRFGGRCEIVLKPGYGPVCFNCGEAYPDDKAVS